MVATDTAMKVTTDAVQVLGGYGYTRDFPAERYLREAKVTQIFEGTNQIQRLVIGRTAASGARGHRPGSRLVRLGDGDVALVTGGASGLGAATVRALIAAGARAVIVDLPSRRAPESPPSWASGVRFVAADVRDEEQVQAAVDAAADLGVLRVAVNCAGVATPGRVIGKRGLLPLEAFRTVVEINLVGTFNVLRLAAQAMLAQRAGRRRPRAGDHDRQRGGVRRADRAGGVRGQQGRHRLADPDRGAGPGAARRSG